jgi:Xaa-Pro aminopeptidase
MKAFSPTPEPRFVDDDRLDRIRNHLSETDLDGFVAFSPANSYYLSGCYAGMYSRPVIGVVTASTSAFVGPRLEERKADRTAWVEKALVYEDSDDPFAVVASAVPESASRLGYDAAQARPEWVDALAGRVEATFTDASEAFRSLRIVKTDWELDKIRRAQDLATAGAAAMAETIRSGTPEIEAVAAVQQAYYDTYLDEHAEFDIGTANELGQYGFASVLAGPHALEPHSISSSRRISEGDSVVGISLPSIQGYVCEEERTFLVGDVDEELEAGMRALAEIREGTIDRVGPGESIAEIDAWTLERIEDAGFGNHVQHRTGHGEGITIHEEPALNAQKEGELKPGMVISIEPGLYFHDEGNALRHSDTLIVTENGAERITETDAGVLRVE